MVPFLKVANAEFVNTFDKVLGAAEVKGPQLSFPAGGLTAREIVEARVRAAVERYNAGDETPVASSLFAPAEAEKALNGPRRSRRTQLEVEPQIDIALNALRAGRVILLFNGMQVVDFDQPLAATPVSEARFLRLVALVGG